MNLTALAIGLWVFMGFLTLLYFKANFKRQAYEIVDKLASNNTPVKSMKMAYFLLSAMSVVFWPAVWIGRWTSNEKD